MTMSRLIINMALLASAATAAMHGPGTLTFRQNLLTPIAVGLRRPSIASSRREVVSTSTATPAIQDDFATVVRGGGEDAACTGTPPARFLKWAYSACGLATTAAWSTCVYTTIRSNQPPGAMMPCAQHGLFARIGAMSAAPLIIGGFAVLANSASKAEDWGDMATPTCRRQNLALVATGVSGALWANFAEIVTRIPGTNPQASHQIYHGAMKYGLIGAYGAGAALGAAVWARSLPDDVRRNPLSWPGRIADGVSQSLVKLAPANCDDPVNVKYSILTASFLAFTAQQTLCNMPISVIPSWTSRRLSRIFPAWTLLAAVTSFDLKEATESGKLLVESNYRTLSNGVRGFGAVYLSARAGAIFLDPSFPEHFGAVTQVPGLAVAAIVLIGLTLRSDKN
ncbi:hypothetical protein ACHAXR_004651 [Thalassiosira sp. AJA248-18]